MNKLNFNLIVLGTGINAEEQITSESINWIKDADQVFYVVGDVPSENLIKSLNPKNSMSLSYLYQAGKPRINTYNEMIEIILQSVRNGKMTVAVFYGHPGVFAYPSHESVKRARVEGYNAKMLAGISAEDCLFADLNIDPCTYGCHSIEATDFLINNRFVDTFSLVILWQIGALGNFVYVDKEYNSENIHLMTEKLLYFYPATHEIWVYEASTNKDEDAKVQRTYLANLPNTMLNSASTLVIPPLKQTTVDPFYYSRIKLKVE